MLSAEQLQQGCWSSHNCSFLVSISSSSSNTRPTHMSRHTSAHTHVYAHSSRCAFTHVRVQICTHVHTHVCMHVHMRVSIVTHVYTHFTHVCTQRKNVEKSVTKMQAHMYACLRTCPHALSLASHRHVCANALTRPHACSHMCHDHEQMLMDMSIRIVVSMSTHMPARVRLRMSIHTFVHTCVYTRV